LEDRLSFPNGEQRQSNRVVLKMFSRSRELADLSLADEARIFTTKSSAEAANQNGKTNSTGENDRTASASACSTKTTCVQNGSQTSLQNSEERSETPKESGIQIDSKNADYLKQPKTIEKEAKKNFTQAKEKSIDSESQSDNEKSGEKRDLNISETVPEISVVRNQSENEPETGTLEGENSFIGSVGISMSNELSESTSSREAIRVSSAESRQSFESNSSAASQFTSSAGRVSIIEVVPEIEIRSPSEFCETPRAQRNQDAYRSKQTVSQNTVIYVGPELTFQNKFDSKPRRGRENIQLSKIQANKASGFQKKPTGANTVGTHAKSRTSNSQAPQSSARARVFSQFFSKIPDPNRISRGTQQNHFTAANGVSIRIQRGPIGPSEQSPFQWH